MAIEIKLTAIGPQGPKGEKGDLVLDNCAGSGTTGVACKRLNRKFILIEQEDKYCQIARDRLDNETEPLFTL